MKGLWKRTECRPSEAKGPLAHKGYFLPGLSLHSFPEISGVQARVGVCGRVSRELEANCIFFAMLGHF